MEAPKHIQKIEKIVTRAANISISDLYSRKRSQHYCIARFIVWFFSYHGLGYSLPYLGKLYGRNHTTILSGINRIASDDKIMKTMRDLYRKNPEIAKSTFPISPRMIDDWDV